MSEKLPQVHNSDLMAEMLQETTGPTVLKCIAQVMLARGDSYDSVQMVTGLARGTIAKVKRGEYRLPAGMLAVLEDAEAEKLTVAAHKMLDAVNEQDPEDLKRLSPASLLLAAGIAIDKRKAIRDHSDARTRSYAAMTDQEILAEMQNLEPELRREGVFDSIEEAEVMDGGGQE